MMPNRQAATHWRECEFVSVANAARIAGRSRTWADDRIVSGELEAFRLPTGGPPVVSVASLRRLLAGAEPIKPDRLRAADARLRLVIDNP